MKKTKPGQFRLLCAYCGEPGSSGEHYWPRWAHKRLGALPAVMRPAGIFAKISASGSATVTPMMRRTGRSRLGDQAKRVCVSCNGGWMSALAGRKDILAPLFFDPPDKILVEDQDLIARWAIMTATTIDTLGSQLFIPQAERDAQRKGDPIGRNWRVWIGRYDGQDWSARWCKAGFAANFGDHGGPSSNHCLFALGRSCFYVVYGVKPTIDFLMRAHKMGLRSIFPSRPTDIDWHDVRAHTDEDLFALEALMNDAASDQAGNRL